MAPVSWARSPTQVTGRQIEDRALTYLKNQGLKLVKRNYRCRLGELDLVMRERELLVFVEVRFRRRSSYGSGAETVDYRKQRKLILTAQHYLQSQCRNEWPACRFDVLAVSNDGKTQTSLHFDWIKNAFDLQ